MEVESFDVGVADVLAHWRSFRGALNIWHCKYPAHVGDRPLISRRLARSGNFQGTDGMWLSGELYMDNILIIVASAYRKKIEIASVVWLSMLVVTYQILLRFPNSKARGDLNPFRKFRSLNTPCMSEFFFYESKTKIRLPANLKLFGAQTQSGDLLRWWSSAVSRFKRYDNPTGGASSESSMMISEFNF